MKIFLAILSLLAFSPVFAGNIFNSALPQRAEEAVSNAIQSECGHISSLSLVKMTVEEIPVDQGITDAIIQLTLNGTQKIDQGMFDNYTIKASILYSDLYDHNSKEYGAYHVNALSCELQ